MSFFQLELIEENWRPTGKTEIGNSPSWSWADIEDVLSGEWEIGGSAMPTPAVRGVVADK